MLNGGSPSSQNSYPMFSYLFNSQNRDYKVLSMLYLVTEEKHLHVCRKVKLHLNHFRELHINVDYLIRHGYNLQR